MKNSLLYKSIDHSGMINQNRIKEEHTESSRSRVADISEELIEDTYKDESKSLNLSEHQVKNKKYIKVDTGREVRNQDQQWESPQRVSESDDSDDEVREESSSFGSVESEIYEELAKNADEVDKFHRVPLPQNIGVKQETVLRTDDQYRPRSGAGQETLRLENRLP